jgi:hypothetical protein
LRFPLDVADCRGSNPRLRSAKVPVRRKPCQAAPGCEDAGVAERIAFTEILLYYHIELIDNHRGEGSSN